MSVAAPPYFPTPAPARATLADWFRVPSKAELIGGRIVHLMATGHRPNVVAGRIYRKLADYADIKGGLAYTDNMGFAVPELLSGRETFSPDAAYYTGPLPANPMKYVSGPPDFAVEVRSDNDYGPAAEKAIAAKRADYFEAGTAVVWDVDPEAKWVKSYTTATDGPVIFRVGEDATAEPAVPGWKISVAWLMG